MNKNKPETKKTGLSGLIVMLLIVILLTSSIGLYAWAKYITTRNEQASVDVGKWNFNLSLRAGQNTVTSPTQTLDLAATYQNVANGRIAPGTSGEFDIVINTQGTEVSMTYDVTIAISDCPRNITFSRQKGQAEPIVVSAGGTDSYTRTIRFTEYLSKENASGEFIETIKWNWPFEGTVNESSTTYDEWDTADQGKTVNLAITVVGTEVLQEPVTKQIGDPVDYSTILNGVTLEDWRVFFIDGDYTYIILDDYLPNAAVSNDLKTTYNLTNGNGAYSIRSTTNRTDLINAMTTTSNWNSLLSGTLNGTIQVNETPKATVYAMGAPTVDLWVNSWNTHNNYATIYTAQTSSAMNDGLIGYYIDTSANPDTNNSYYANLSGDNGYNNPLYFPHKGALNDCFGYWLASPGGGRDEYVMNIYFIGFLDRGSAAIDDTFAFRPIIRLPSNVVNQ